MLKKLHQQKLLLPSLFFLPVLSCLLFLGKWQLERKIWKDGLLHEMSSRLTLEPQDLDSLLKKLNFTDNGQPTLSLDYYPVKVRGSFLHEKELYFYAPDQSLGAGYHVYTPFLVKNSGGILMVNRGFVPENKKDPQSRRDGQNTDDIEIIGLIRMPGKQGVFVPDNNSIQNLWFWRDLEGMLQASFKNTSLKRYPFFLETLKEAPGRWPMGGATLLSLPNRHLEYAYTWFGLAFAFLIIYVVYVLSCLRKSS